MDPAAGTGHLRAEVVPYALPFRRTYRAAPGALERRELVLLRVTDRNGITGLGEGVPLSLRGGASTEAVVEVLKRWALAAEEQGLSTLPEGPAPARCAVATALADLEAKIEGVPLHVLLGGTPDRLEVRCNAAIGADPVEDVATQGELLAAAGFRRFKLKVGVPGDRERVAALRSVIGPEGMIRLDANGAWTAEQAIRFVDVVGSGKIELLEQPAHDLAGLAEVRAGQDVPVVADESVSSPEEASEAARLEACDAVTIKISKVGGLDGSLGGFLPTYISSALDGPVGIAAAGHLAATLPEQGPTGSAFHGLATLPLFDGTIASAGPELDGDRLILPPGPGCGVEIDESALDRYRL